MKNEYPDHYLTKRSEKEYAVISNGFMICDFTEKEYAIKRANRMNIKLSDMVWDSKQLKFIQE
jgi:hypothetical protein